MLHPVHEAVDGGEWASDKLWTQTSPPFWPSRWTAVMPELPGSVTPFCCRGRKDGCHSPFVPWIANAFFYFYEWRDTLNLVLEFFWQGEQWDRCSGTDNNVISKPHFSGQLIWKGNKISQPQADFFWKIMHIYETPTLNDVISITGNVKLGKGGVFPPLVFTLRRGLQSDLNHHTFPISRILYNHLD